MEIIKWIYKVNKKRLESLKNEQEGSQMYWIFFLKSLEAVLEIIFLCLAIYHFVRGIKTKEYRKASTFFSLYLILNMIRRIIGF